MMKKFILIAAVLVTLTGCQSRPLAYVNTANPEVDLAKIFEVDGCNVYRFTDGATTKYLTTCPGSVSFESGKLDDSIQTVTTKANE